MVECFANMARRGDATALALIEDQIDDVEEVRMAALQAKTILSEGL